MRPFKQWPMKYRMILIFSVFILFFFMFMSRAHADDNTTDRAKELAKDAAIDALAAVVAMAGAAEQAATGNLATGIALATLSAAEASKAYQEAREAWNLYYSDPGGNNAQENISPEQSNCDHGRD